MKIQKSAAIAALVLTVAGCASYQANTDLHNGRMALLRGMPQVAIPYLERATTFDGELRYSPLLTSPWTYLGRANYEAKRYPQARQALGRAVEINRDDGMAKLYLGLTLAREGNHAGGQKEILGGLKNLDETLNFIVYNTRSGPYWDPSGKLRREVTAAQVDVAAADLNLDKMIPRLENIAVSIDEEIDLARRDESFEFRHNSGSDM